MTISWVLFDADGVLQRMPPGWQDSLLGRLGDEPVETLAELFTREREETIAGGDFGALVADTLRRRGLSTDPELVLDSWRTLVVDRQLTDRIKKLRTSGIGCALATNQQDVRVAYMRSLPDYADVFDEQFYSSELGLAKPDPAFFEVIIQRLGIEPDEALFVDDVAANVAGARVAGLAAEVFEQDAGIAELERILARYQLT
ncbi:HAD-IA family hydrolase [Microlunatus elymi]|uniref:HAD-IA family hydrolase n=1 Tax=Microlunatus elymi TaxID=2596828 RepID=A0A516PV37_9ACTN|nr:HAD-IA family hydrolase [Microlunatus elymi]QDP95054.1 HAD-IA family hydrolase [Microlunatus elymi]